MLIVKKLLLKILLAIDVLAIIIGGVCSVIIERYDAVSGFTTDGFGRVLVETPHFVKWYLRIGEWAGLGWHIIDTICFFALLAVADFLYKEITNKK